MCHRASAASAWRCGCGHEFSQTAERVRALLRDQQTSAWITLIALVMLDGAAAAGAVYAAVHGFIVIAALGFTALTLLTVRAVRKLLVTRATLRQLARRDPALPRAILRRR